MIDFWDQFDDLRNVATIYLYSTYLLFTVCARDLVIRFDEELICPNGLVLYGLNLADIETHPLSVPRYHRDTRFYTAIDVSHKYLSVMMRREEYLNYLGN